jgi:hypothetical protein
LSGDIPHRSPEWKLEEEDEIQVEPGETLIPMILCVRQAVSPTRLRMPT